jgi:outer membrane lipoprotein carrier protein
MHYFLGFAFIFLLSPQSKTTGSETLGLVQGVERVFAQMKDFSSDFHQVFQNPSNRKQEESGHVYLKRSRLMRWEYKNPEEKYFISDGKTVYSYVPADRQVNKEAVKETFDDRVPMMFLLGRSNLRDEFSSFALLKTNPDGTKAIRMYPKRKTDIQELVMDVDPATYHIRRLLLAHMDGSRSEFIFSNIRINTGVQASLFEFKVPPGVQVVEGLGQ